jgi:hypothetical protein
MIDRRYELRAREAWADLRVRAQRADVHGSVVAPVPAGEPLAANCIVFSKDRAMQLEACLSSIARFAPYQGIPTVIFKASSSEFGAAYEQLEGSAVLVREGSDFRRTLLEAIDGSLPHTVFHTDDDVFFRQPASTPILPEGFAAFSLRLGENTSYCYPLASEQPVPRVESAGPLMAWDWRTAEGDFAYPMSLDGHLLSTALVLRMLARARFKNPNELEEELHLRRYLAPGRMLAFRQSCMVGIPANVVSSSHENRSAGRPEWSPSRLNARFLDGERIDLEAMDFASVAGAHQEIALAFRPAARLMTQEAAGAQNEEHD